MVTNVLVIKLCHCDLDLLQTVKAALKIHRQHVGSRASLDTTQVFYCQDFEQRRKN